MKYIYVDEDLTTGNADGTTEENAYQSWSAMTAIEFASTLTENTTVYIKSTGVVDTQRDLNGVDVSVYALTIEGIDGCILYGTSSYTHTFRVNNTGSAGKVIVKSIYFKTVESSNYGLRVSTFSDVDAVNCLCEGHNDSIYSQSNNNKTFRILNCTCEGDINGYSGGVEVINTYCKSLSSDIANYDITSGTVATSDDTGNIFDLTGYTMTFTAKSTLSLTDDEAEIKETAIIDDPATGLGAFTLLPTQTNISVGNYYYDVQISDGADNVYTIIKKSTLTITDEVTSTN